MMKLSPLVMAAFAGLSSFDGAFASPATGSSSGSASFYGPQGGNIIEDGFRVWTDGYDHGWQVVNGRVLYHWPAETYAEEGPDVVELGICTETHCSTGNVRAVVTGESVSGGDLIILDLGWEDNDDLHVECPNIFQNPKAELLACEADDDDDCDPDMCVDDDIVCLDGFDIEEDDLDQANPGGSLTLGMGDPTGDWVRVRVAIFCEDPTIEFAESKYAGGKGKGGGKGSRKLRPAAATATRGA